MRCTVPTAEPVQDTAINELATCFAHFASIFCHITYFSDWALLPTLIRRKSTPEQARFERIYAPICFNDKRYRVHFLYIESHRCINYWPQWPALHFLELSQNPEILPAVAALVTAPSQKKPENHPSHRKLCSLLLVLRNVANQRPPRGRSICQFSSRSE